jgi:hypothetical protein
VAERFADREATEKERDEACVAARDSAEGLTGVNSTAAWAAAHPGYLPHDMAARTVERSKLTGKRVADLLRCVVGNPFRHAALADACRTATVASLAEAAYTERHLPDGALDAARLAVLADALEEAGCAEVSVLEHLRSRGPHVRGCWAVDLSLGKE